MSEQKISWADEQMIREQTLKLQAKLSSEWVD